jgi:phenylalanyl-tRNA synthetase beta chain
MRVPLSLLGRFISLPTTEPLMARPLFDDIGLEVKGVDEKDGETFFTVETLAHRGDHQSMAGIAREFSARYLTAIKMPSMATELTKTRLQLPVRVDTELCPRYALLELMLPERFVAPKDVTKFLDSYDETKPGIVHVLNYVQKEFGQPMHAFDRAKVEGEVRVVTSESPESIEGLDGKTYTVPAGAILIRDKTKTIAVAGIIGCANSCVDVNTRKVLIESACFDPVATRKAAKAMGIATDASFVFERGSDVELCITALKRVVTLCAGAGGAAKDGAGAHELGVIDVNNAVAFERKFVIALKRFKSAMNLPKLDDVEIMTRLKQLGYAVELLKDKKTISVSVPSWRKWNVEYSSAVIEDFVRIHGLNNVKIAMPPLTLERFPADLEDQVIERLEPVLIGSGFLEVVTKSYCGSSETDVLASLFPESKEQQISLNNSLEKGYSQLKQSNLIPLCKLLDAYFKKGGLGAKVFEIGRVFEKTPSIAETTYAHETSVLTLAAGGRWNEHEWQKEEGIEFLGRAFKGVLETLLRTFALDVQAVSHKHPYLHPGKQAALMLGKQMVGAYGVVHPHIVKSMGFSKDMVFAELYLPRLASMLCDRELARATDYPSVKRDITLKVPAASLAGEIKQRIAGMKEDNLAAVEIVDDFKRTDETFRRVSFRVSFQSSERTLEHKEIDASMEAIIKRLKDKDRLEMA